MKKKRIVEKLAEYSLPGYSEEALLQTIKSVLNAVPEQKRRRAGRLEFFISQVLFIRKRVWILQFAFVAVFCVIYQYAGVFRKVPKEFLILFSISVPVLVMIHVAEFTRTYQHSMWELESSTKNPLHSVLTIKMAVFGLADILVLGFIIGFANWMLEISLLQIVLYCLVPFHAMCIGCLEIICRYRRENIIWGCMSYGVVLAGFFLVFGVNYKPFYQPSSIHFWLTAFLVSAVGLVYEVRRSIGNAACGGRGEQV